MNRHLLKRIIVSRRHVATNVARVLSSNDPYGKDMVLRYDQISHHDDRRGNVIRHAMLIRNVRSENGNEAFLAGNCVGAVRQVADFGVNALISSNVSNGNHLANLTIASGRFALSATSECRNVRDLRANL